MADAASATLELIAATLWIAPVYAWILFVSAWARRAVLLLAFVPSLLVTMIAVMGGASSDIGNALFYRGVGRHWPLNVSVGAVSNGPMVNSPAPQLLCSPEMWIGVIVAGLLLVPVTKLRRRMTALDLTGGRPSPGSLAHRSRAALTTGQEKL